MTTCRYRNCGRDARPKHTMCGFHVSAGISRKHFDRMQRQREKRAKLAKIVAACAECKTIEGPFSDGATRGRFLCPTCDNAEPVTANEMAGGTRPC